MPRFSATLLDHAESPRNGGKLDSANAVGMASLNGQAPYTTIHLRIEENEAIADAKFEAFGCGVTIAACSALTELVIGQTVSEAEELSPTDITSALDGIPPDKQFCAHLANSALHNAIESWRDNFKKGTDPLKSRS